MRAIKSTKNAFIGRTDLISVTIPKAVTAIGKNAFNGCYNLIEVIDQSPLYIRKGSDDNGCVAQYTKAVHSHSSSDLANAFNDCSAL